MSNNEVCYIIFHIELNYGKFVRPTTPEKEHQFFYKWGRNPGWFKDNKPNEPHHVLGQEFYERIIAEYPNIMKGLTPADIAYGIEYGLCSFYSQPPGRFTIQHNIPLVRWDSKLNQERALKFRAAPVKFGFMTMEDIVFLMSENSKSPD